MSGFLYFVGVLAWVLGVLGFFAAPAVTQEMVGVQVIIAGSVLIVGGAIVDAINKAHTTLALAATSANKYMHPGTAAEVRPAEQFHG